jgi:CheY-like chemotaxis protein
MVYQFTNGKRDREKRLLGLDFPLARWEHAAVSSLYLAITQPADVEPSKGPVYCDPLNRCVVLIAEEQPLLREHACDLLQHTGYAILSTSSSHEVLSISHSVERILDLVIIDSPLDGMSGFEICRNITSIRANIKILMLSRLPILESAAAHRGITFLQKPFRGVVFKERVRQLLDSDPTPGSRTDDDGQNKRVKGATILEFHKRHSA